MRRGFEVQADTRHTDTQTTVSDQYTFRLGYASGENFRNYISRRNVITKIIVKNFTV